MRFTGDYMRITKPEYYDEFVCIADKCTDTCCALWQVELDETDAERYKSFIADGTETGKMLDSVTDRRITRIKQDGCGRCTLLNDSSLCDLQTVAGHDALPRTCRLYPRFFNTFGQYEETGLSFSCPEAARIISGSASKLVCVEDDRKISDYTDVDAELFFKIRKLRNELLELLDEMEGSVNDIERALLNFSVDAQNIIDNGNNETFDSELYVYRSIIFNEQARIKAIKNHIGNSHLRKEWKATLKKAAASKPTYNREEMECWLKYFIFRYVIKACEDGDFLGRIKAALVSYAVIASTGEPFTVSAQKYSKETEHNLRNINRLFDFSKKIEI